MNASARPVRIGVSLWAQAGRWDDLLAACRLVEEVGLDDLWTSDHVLGTVGRARQPVFDAYAVLAAWAVVTRRVRIGPMVSPVALRRLGLLAKAAVTLDHISGGRLVLGIGAGNSRDEHDAVGATLGETAFQRAAVVEASVDQLRRLFDGEAVPLGDERGASAMLELMPLPIQSRLPLLIGGTSVHILPAIARHADIWNAYADDATLLRKRDELDAICQAIGRDGAEIERTASCKVVIRSTEREAQAVWSRQLAANGIDEYARTPWLGPPERIVERMQTLIDLGFTTLVVEQLAPYDSITIRMLGEVVRPELAERVR